MENKRYLGDGVYATFDGYNIWLSTQEGMRIALEQAVLADLIAYNSDLMKHIREHGTIPK
jgi:hypothetical protein